MLKDLNHAARALLQAKGWTTVVLVSLALGIGANAALFSSVNALLIRTVSVPEPGTLVALGWTGDNDMVRSQNEYGSRRPEAGQDVWSTFSYPAFLQLRAANKTLTDLTACAPIGSVNVVNRGSAELATAFGVAGNYFAVLGVRPWLGRTIHESDEAPSAPAVAVISHAYWTRRFGGDPDILGQAVTMNNNAVAIVGVLPPEFNGIQRPTDTAPDVTVPLALDPRLNLEPSRLTDATSWWAQIVGRLKPGVTRAQVGGNLNGVFQQAARDGMAAFEATLTDAERGLSENQRKGAAVPSLLVKAAGRGLYDVNDNDTRSIAILAAVVVLVLLIVCANVANLLLSRASARRKEVAVRMAMGATRARLVRQLLTESLLLSSVGGGLGLLVAYWIRQVLPFGPPAPIDWHVLAFVAGVSVATGIVFGMVPALRATRLHLSSDLKEHGRSVTGARSRLSRGLVVLQVSVSLVLIVGAGLFLGTLRNLRAVDVGFNAGNLLMFRVNPQLNRYGDDRTTRLYLDLTEALGAVPGVRAVALAQPPLLSGSMSMTSLWVEGQTAASNVHVLTVSPEFFATMEIPLLAGRSFTNRDLQTSPKVLVINESAARQLFPDGDPIGRRVGSSVEKSGDVEIIGVTRDAKYRTPRDPAPPTIYRPYLQGAPRGMSVLVRTAGDPMARLDAVREAVKAIDPNLPMASVSTQADQIENRLTQERMFATAYALLGGLALVLASIGLFGLMSYSVARRTNEIGVRMALGAARSDVAQLVMTESLRLVAVGIAIGIAIVLVAGRLVAAILFGLAPTDAATLAAAIGVMAVVAVAASYLPARRASRVDPMVALRCE